MSGARAPALRHLSPACERYTLAEYGAYVQPNAGSPFSLGHSTIGASIVPFVDASSSLSNRRHFLRLGVCATAASLVPEAAAAPGADFSFAVLTDLHYRDARCGEWLERVATQLRSSRPRPAFVVLAGDLTDEGTAEQLGAVREIFRDLPMPVRTILGNHDCTPEGNRAAYEQLFGSSLSYRFTQGDYQFLAVDSTQGRGVYRTKIPTETLTWLDRQLPSISREKPLVVLTHFPLGRNWLRPLNASAVLQRLRPFNFQAAFSGHWHGLTERVEHGVPLSTGRCCSWWCTNHDGSDLRGYTLCHASHAGVRHEFVSVRMA
jgi:hypothetical protein